METIERTYAAAIAARDAKDIAIVAAGTAAREYGMDAAVTVAAFKAMNDAIAAAIEAQAAYEAAIRAQAATTGKAVSFA